MSLRIRARWLPAEHTCPAMDSDGFNSKPIVWSLDHRHDTHIAFIITIII